MASESFTRVGVAPIARAALTSDNGPGVRYPDRVRKWLRDPRRHLRTLWERAKGERAKPRQIGLAVFVGAFVGCAPFIGFHGPAALGAATLLRLNRLFCFLGSRISNPVLMPFLIYAQVQVGHSVRTGQMLELSAKEIAAQGPALLLDWTIGLIPVGFVVSGVCGGLAMAWATRRDRLRERRETEGREAPPLRATRTNIGSDQA